jgi:hypothetical protein
MIRKLRTWIHRHWPTRHNPEPLFTRAPRDRDEERMARLSQHDRYVKCPKCQCAGVRSGNGSIWWNEEKSRVILEAAERWNNAV